MKKLSEKCAVITGAASGLGFALAQSALDQQMNVVISDVDESLLNTAASKLGDVNGRLVARVIDVSNLQDIESLCDTANTQFGGTDLLINNAGRMLNKFTWEHSAEDWQSILGVNIGGVTNALSTFVPKMIKRGTPAHIVNIGSIASFLPSPMMCSYTVSKFSVSAISETLKYELDMLDIPIDVSLVAPGPVDTSIFEPSRTSKKHARESEQGELLRRTMAAAVKSFGMDAKQAAEIIFTGVRENRFWIFTHPELLSDLELRGKTIAAGVAPMYQSPELLD